MDLPKRSLMKNNQLTNEEKAYYKEHNDELLKLVQKSSARKCLILFAATIIAFITSCVIIAVNKDTVNSKDITYVTMAFIGFVLLVSAFTMRGIIRNKAISLTFLIKFFFGAAFFLYSAYCHASLVLGIKEATMYQLYYPMIPLIPMTMAGLLRIEIGDEIEKLMVLKSMIKKGTKIEFADERNENG